MMYITVTFLVKPEGEYHVARCIELDISSFGRDEDEAVAQVAGAALMYLNILEDLGECDMTVREKGVPGDEADARDVRKVSCPPDGTIHASVFPLPAYASAGAGSTPARKSPRPCKELVTRSLANQGEVIRPSRGSGRWRPRHGYGAAQSARDSRSHLREHS